MFYAIYVSCVIRVVYSGLDKEVLPVICNVFWMNFIVGLTELIATCYVYHIFCETNAVLSWYYFPKVYSKWFSVSGKQLF